MNQSVALPFEAGSLSATAVAVAFVVLRLGARLVGGWIGDALSGVPSMDRNMFGIALLPQAGVAIGMALVAAQEFPDWGSEIMALTVGSTVIFELIGPVGCLYAIRRSVKAAQEN